MQLIDVIMWAQDQVFSTQILDRKAISLVALFYKYGHFPFLESSIFCMTTTYIFAYHGETNAISLFSSWLVFSAHQGLIPKKILDDCLNNVLWRIGISHSSFIVDNHDFDKENVFRDLIEFHASLWLKE